MKTDRQPGGLGTGLGLGTDAQPGQDHGGRPGAEPDEAARSAFERLLAGEPGDPRLRPPPPPLPGGPAAAPTGPAVAPPPGDLGPLVEEVAERVLVSDGRFDARGEVRIKVRDSVFPGLEVRLRQVDGRLQVELVAAQSGDLVLLRREGQRLLQSLRERLGREVELRLAVEAADGTLLSSEPVDAAPASGPAPLPRGPAG